MAIHFLLAAYFGSFIILSALHRFLPSQNASGIGCSSVDVEVYAPVEEIGDSFTSQWIPELRTSPN
eukprot:scaffold152346_cov69-Cyclotella_meneghiniana.AAC.5